MTKAQSAARSDVIKTRIPPATLSVVASILLLLSFVLKQLFVPAAGPVPAMTLDFGDLQDLIGSRLIPTTGFQEAYFNWLAWTLAIFAIGLTLASSVLGNKPTALLAGVVGVLGFVSSVIGNKGPLSWTEFVDQLPNLRIGAYCNLIGFIVVISAALLAARRTNGRRP